MAQRPWEILRDRPIALPEANDFLRKALRDLSASTANASNKATLPCPRHIYDTLYRLMTHLDELLLDKKKRRIFEGPGSSKHRSAPYKTPKTPFHLFRKLVIRGLVQLMPLHLTNTEFGVKLFLSNFLLNYVPEFQGVWLAYRKVRSADDKGFSYDAERLGIIVFRVDMEILVFSPKQGDILLSEVTEVRNDGLDTLLLSTWRTFIPSTLFLPGSVISLKKSGALVKVKGAGETAKEQIIEKGNQVKFIVSRLECGGGRDFFSLEGSLKPIRLAPT